MKRLAVLLLAFASALLPAQAALAGAYPITATPSHIRFAPQSGGTVSFPKRIARNVLPQMSDIPAKAAYSPGLRGSGVTGWFARSPGGRRPSRS